MKIDLLTRLRIGVVIQVITELGIADTDKLTAYGVEVVHPVIETDVGEIIGTNVLQKAGRLEASALINKAAVGVPIVSTYPGFGRLQVAAGTAPFSVFCT